MNPALFYRGKDKTILPADLVATYLTYHANKAEDMKLLFKIRLLEKEEKISLREIKWRKHQLEAELKQKAEDYFGCHRVFSEQSLVSTSDSFKKNLYLGPYPTKGLIPSGRLTELREKLRSMHIGNQKAQALARARLLYSRRRQRYTSPPPESVRDISADNIGVIEPIETLVGQESKTDILEQPPTLEPIKSPDQKPEIIGETHDSLHEIQKLKFKRIQSAPMPKHSREKAEGQDLEGRPHAKHKSKVKVGRAKTCGVTRRERLTAGFKFAKEPYRMEEKTTTKKETKEEKSEFDKGRPWSYRSRKTKRPRPKSSPFLSAIPKHLDSNAQGSRARSALSSRQRPRESDGEKKYTKIVSKFSLKAMDTESSSLSRDERISRKDVLEEKKPGILRMRTAARLNFSKAHRLVCKSFANSVTDETVQVDGEEMVRRYLDDSLQMEKKSIAGHKQGRGKRGSRDVELEIKGQARVTHKTELRIKIPQEEFPNVESERTETKMALAEKGHTEERASVSHKDVKRHSMKRWTNAVGHVIDQGECKRFVGHQAKKQTGKKRKLSIFKKRSFTDQLKGKQLVVESDMRKKVLEYMKVYKDEEVDENAGDRQQEDGY